MVPEDDQDLISKLPTNVTDKILEQLPLLMAARISVLSKTWMDNWLSLRNLVFDADFWVGQKQNGSLDGQKYCSIITNTLLFHNGPIHKFHLYVPDYLSFKEGCLNFSPWLSFLSKNGVKKMKFDNWFCDGTVRITSHIYRCTNLEKLRLEYVTLSPPPTDFEGFANLRKLELVQMSFKFDPLQSLIARCPRLEVLRIISCTGMNHIVIDAPSLKTLVIIGFFKSLHFKNIQNIFSVKLCWKETKDDSVKAELVDAMVMLANSCELQFLHLGGDLCKFLAAGGITRSFPLAFNHLCRLSLVELDLGDFDVYCCTCFLIYSCPNINNLQISVASNENAVQHNYDYCSKKLSHLRTVKIMGIRGTVAELKLIEHLLSISDVLENLFYKCDKVDADTELKMSRELMKLPRVSPKARLVYLEA